MYKGDTTEKQVGEGVRKMFLEKEYQYSRWPKEGLGRDLLGKGNNSI